MYASSECLNEMCSLAKPCLSIRSSLLTKRNKTTLTNFSTKYLVMCKVYTYIGGIKYLYNVCPPVRKTIHSLKFVDYLHVQADNPWFNNYMSELLWSAIWWQLNCHRSWCFISTALKTMFFSIVLIRRITTTIIGRNVEHLSLETMLALNRISRKVGVSLQ